MSKLASLISKAVQKLRYGMLTQSLLDRLKYVGLVVYPYYLEKEQYIAARDLEVSIKPKLESLTTNFLEADEIENMMGHPEKISAKENYSIKDRIIDGCLCFGVRHGQEVIAYTWCDLRRCNHKPLSFDLKHTEAYLFDMYTFEGFRGGNVAPFMRHELYSQLIEMGRTDFFSVTNSLNNVSIRFKRKLGAHPTRLYLYFKAGKQFERNILLRSY